MADDSMGRAAINDESNWQSQEKSAASSHASVSDSAWWQPAGPMAARGQLPASRAKSGPTTPAAANAAVANLTDDRSGRASLAPEHSAARPLSITGPAPAANSPSGRAALSDSAARRPSAAKVPSHRHALVDTKPSHASAASGYGTTSTLDAAPGKVTIADDPAARAEIIRAAQGQGTASNRQQHTGWKNIEPSSGAPTPMAINPGWQEVAETASSAQRSTATDHAGPLPRIASGSDHEPAAKSGLSSLLPTTGAPVPEISVGWIPPAAERVTEESTPAQPNTQGEAGETATVEAAVHSEAAGAPDTATSVVTVQAVEPAVTPATQQSDSAGDGSGQQSAVIASTSIADAVASAPVDDNCSPQPCGGESCNADSAAVVGSSATKQDPKAEESPYPGWFALEKPEGAEGKSAETSDGSADAASPPAALAEERSQSQPGQKETAPVLGWRAEPAAKSDNNQSIVTANASEPNRLAAEHESLPRPPSQSHSVLPVKGAAAAPLPGGHPLVEQTEGPALTGPVPPGTFAGTPGRHPRKTTEMPALQHAEISRRKGSNLAAIDVRSPRKVALFEADEPATFEPPAGSDAGNEAEPAADLEPLLNPSNRPDTTEGRADVPLLTGPSASPGNPPAANPDEQKLGEAPVDTSLRFLRQQTVLLKPGEMQF
ncbi:MAG: hypothetical protein AB7I48_21905, partial [Planctomycetaceae bacterium]